MNFFKHYVTGHNSTPMLELMDEFGVEGYGAYFILVEICVDKIQKNRDEDLSEDHCHIRFHEREVRQKLRFRSTKVELFLNSCATKGLLEWTKDGQKLNIYLPKILEFLERGQKRGRNDRAESGPKDIDKDIDIDSARSGPGKADKYNSAARSEARFHPDYNQYLEGLKQVGTLATINFKQRIPSIAKRFESYDNFKTWAESILNTQKFTAMANEEERQRYFSAALSNALTETT